MDTAEPPVVARSSPRPPPTPRSGVDRPVVVQLVVVHVLGLGLAPFTFSVEGVWALVVLHLVAGFGVTAGAHRLFMHRSFVPKPVLREILAFAFLISAQGSLRRWVRDHAIHHRYADQEGDPHSPATLGFWFAHLRWQWMQPATRAEDVELYLQWTRGLNPGRVGRYFRTLPKIAALHGSVIVALFAIGLLLGDWRTGVSMVVWGVFLRILLSMHITFLVNSATHLWGRRRYDTADDSRNLAWVALLAQGEGWHNNHHHRPGAANNGFHAWWELDVTFLLLLMLGALGLLTDLRVFRPRTGEIETWFPSAASRVAA